MLNCKPKFYGFSVNPYLNSEFQSPNPPSSAQLEMILPNTNIVSQPWKIGIKNILLSKSGVDKYTFLVNPRSRYLKLMPLGMTPCYYSILLLPGKYVRLKKFSLSSWMNRRRTFPSPLHVKNLGFIYRTLLISTAHLLSLFFSPPSIFLHPDYCYCFSSFHLSKESRKSQNSLCVIIWIYGATITRNYHGLLWDL